MDTASTRAYAHVFERELERFFVALDSSIALCGVTDQEAVEIVHRVGGFDLADSFENWITG